MFRKPCPSAPFAPPFSLELVGFTQNYLSVFSFANILIKYSQYPIRLQTIHKHTITITNLYFYTKHFYFENIIYREKTTDGCGGGLT